MINKGFLKLLIIIVLFFMASKALADDIKSIGTPYLQNYSKADYLADNQNWSIAKGKNGVMYFGNTEGLLTFDGKYWEQYKMPHKQIVRAVATANDGTVYTGGFGEFGYWKMVDKHLKFFSLIKMLPKNHKLADEIWKIYVDGPKVFFQSFSSIYIYENNTIAVVKAPTPFLFLHKAGKRIIVEVLGKGLFELKGTKLIPLIAAGAQIPTNLSSTLNNLIFGK